MLCVRRVAALLLPPALLVALLLALTVAPVRVRAATCGDNVCERTDGETCLTCAQDCGACIICGDGVCNAGTETCVSCPQDCTCRCGDGFCNAAGGETCNSCSADCGSCPVVCGDGTCSFGENCFVCPQDCGECGSRCGDGTCLRAANETCFTCPQDCGDCGPYCGDGVCNGVLGNWEGCGSCPEDCGYCWSTCGNGDCDGGSNNQPWENCYSCAEDCGTCESQVVSPDTTEIAMYLLDYAFVGRSPQLFNRPGVTDYVYYSVVPRADGTIDTQYITSTYLNALVNMSRTLERRTHLVIGGSGTRSANFNALATSMTARVKFLKSMWTLVGTYQLDGIVLDWQFPSDGTQINVYHTWITEVYRYLHRRRKWLSVTVAGNRRTIQPWTQGYVDRVHVLSYTSDPDEFSTFNNAKRDLEDWSSFGIPRYKLMLAVPMFARSFEGQIKPWRLMIRDTPALPDDLDAVDEFAFNGPATVMAKMNMTMEGRFRGAVAIEAGQDTFTKSRSLVEKIILSRFYYTPSSASRSAAGALGALALALASALVVALFA